MRFIARTIHCRSLRSGTVARLPSAPSQAQYWDRACCGGNGLWCLFSRQRERVTGRRFAPNSFVEAHVMSFSTDKEPDNVKETPTHYFAAVAAGGDISSGPSWRDNLGQAVLAQ